MADNFCNFLNLADQIRQSSFSTGVPSSQELASRNRPYCLLLSAVWWNTNYRWWQDGVCATKQSTLLPSIGGCPCVARNGSNLNVLALRIWVVGINWLLSVRLGS